MSLESVAPVISSRYVRMFVKVALQEVGAEKLPRVLEKVNLSPSVLGADSIDRLTGTRAAELYALLQQARKPVNS